MLSLNNNKILLEEKWDMIKSEGIVNKLLFSNAYFLFFLDICLLSNSH